MAALKKSPADIPKRRSAKIDKPVISYKNLSRKAPISPTIYCVILVELFKLYRTVAGCISIGFVSVFILFMWAMFLIDAIKYEEKPVDVFKDRDVIGFDD